MILGNPWVGYLTRSFKTIKVSLINRLATIAPEIQDVSESNILIIILSIFAGLTEQMHYYIDNMAREVFLPTCRLFSSAVKNVAVLDYRVKSAIPAQVSLYFTYLDIGGNPVEITENGVIPVGTIVLTPDGVQFCTTKDLTVPVGSSYGVVASKQMVKVVDDETLGNTNGVANQRINLPLNYAHNSLEVSINGQDFNRVNTLARSLSNSKDFTVDVDDTGTPYLKFGNGVNGVIPDSGFALVASYYTTNGKSGNSVSPLTINTSGSSLVLPTPAVSIVITNAISPIGGADVETTQDIINNAPLSIRTLNRAVTNQDYTDMALQADSIVKANTIRSCGKKLIVYIAPAGGGIADAGLISDTYDFLQTVKMNTTDILVLAAGITPVYCQLLVTARFRQDKIQCAIDCDSALGDTFSFDNQSINGRIALSDVIALIDNLPRVDTVELQALYTLPYPFPGTNTISMVDVIPLDWTRQTLPGSIAKHTWSLTYTGTAMRVYMDGQYLGDAPINTVYTDPKSYIQFRVNPGMYIVGDNWSFTSYPYLATITTDDNTIPIIVSGQTTNITVQ